MGYAKKLKPVLVLIVTQVQIQTVPQHLLNHILVNVKQLQRKVLGAADHQGQVVIAGNMEGND